MPPGLAKRLAKTGRSLKLYTVVTGQSIPSWPPPSRRMLARQRHNALNIAQLQSDGPRKAWASSKGAGQPVHSRESLWANVDSRAEKMTRDHPRNPNVRWSPRFCRMTIPKRICRNSSFWDSSSLGRLHWFCGASQNPLPRRCQPCAAGPHIRHIMQPTAGPEMFIPHAWSW